MQLIDQIQQKLSTDSLSVLKLANITRIPAYRIYKWLDGKGKPKADDAKIIELWLSGNLEEVPSLGIKPSIVSEGGDLGSANPNLYERLIAAEEARRKEVEDRRIRAEKQADEYLQIIKDNLTALLVSSSKNQELLLKIWDEQTSDDQVIMDNQDVAAKNPKGTSSGKSDSYQIKLATARKEAQQKTGKGKHVKANR